jgi:AraC-like DNA-binding protein
MLQAERQPASSSRQDAGLWATLAKPHAAGTAVPWHQHRGGQLVFAVRGVMLVQTHAARWTVPPQRALWVPPSHLHSIQFVSNTEMRTVYCQPALIAGCESFSRRDEVHVVVASALIRELVLGLFDERFDHDTRHLMVSLLLQTLRQSADLPTHLPMPVSQALRDVLAMLLDTNRWHLPLHEIASAAAMSERTFSRRFAAETGLSFRAWRQRARIVASLDFLASGRSVKAIARSLHFASAAAFVASFRDALGCTPQTFRHDGLGGSDAA